MSKKSGNFKSLLADINKLNDQETYQIYVPSLGREVPFSPLTVKQQKKILSSGVDTKIENLTFSNSINEIMATNIKESNIEIYTIDRPLIILQIRANSIGDDLKLYIDTEEYNISISDQVKKIKRLKASETSMSFTMSAGDMRIKCSVPDIKTDTEFNKHFTTKVKRGNSNNRLELTDLIGDIYVHEIVKFIDSITLGENTVNFDTELSTTEMIEIFESLPLSVSAKITDEIQRIRKIEIESIESDVMPEGSSISIDASIFTSE